MPYYPTPRQPRQQRICLNCGKDFSVTATLLRHGRGKCCTADCSYAYRTRPPEERFWEKVNKESGHWWDGTQCWDWTGAAMKSGGYGAFTLARGVQTVRAHRFAYELAYGPILKGLVVLHGCDRPTCVNPAHLFPGTQHDNLADMRRKGREGKHNRVHGTAHHMAKLHPDAVRAIRIALTGGQPHYAIAAQFGVSEKTILNIAHGRIWKHVS